MKAARFNGPKDIEITDIPAAFHNTGHYQNNTVECDLGRPKPGSGRCAG